MFVPFAYQPVLKPGPPAPKMPQHPDGLAGERDSRYFSPEFPVSALYLIALCGVCAILLGVMLEAMARVTRKPVWHSHRSSYVAPEEAPIVVEQGPAAALLKPPALSIPMLAVDERHSGFVGLTNNEDFQLTA